MKKSRIPSPVSHAESPLRHLPLVDVLVDTKTELLELALRSGLKVFTAMLEEDRTALGADSQGDPPYGDGVCRAWDGFETGFSFLHRPRVPAIGHRWPAALTGDSAAHCSLSPALQ